MTLEPALLGAALAFGLVSGVHCAGMCGGIVAAFSTRPVSFGTPGIGRQLAFNAGRIATYSLLGAAAGAAGGLVFNVGAAQAAVFYAANAALVLIGLHVAGATRLLSLFERIGSPLWRLFQPQVGRLLSAPRNVSVFAAGLGWGFIPCGLVYAAIATAAFAGGALQGALSMAAFGTGTLPWLLAAGVGAARLRSWMHKRAVRVALGSVILAFGVAGLARAEAATQTIRNLICS
jgi:uncharacterized protein